MSEIPDTLCCVCATAPMSEPVRRFSSCSTDFSQQIAQVVHFLFLSRFAAGGKIGLERVNITMLFYLIFIKNLLHTYKLCPHSIKYIQPQFHTITFLTVTVTMSISHITHRYADDLLPQ
jgi:hypothetical protein